eukprot:4266132-Amphidinium_carterae.1
MERNVLATTQFECLKSFRWAVPMGTPLKFQEDSFASQRLLLRPNVTPWANDESDTKKLSFFLRVSEGLEN